MENLYNEEDTTTIHCKTTLEPITDKKYNFTLSNSVKKRFVKDFSLPIQVIQEPYFSYYIDTLDEQYDTKKKLSYLYEMLDTFESTDKEKSFFEISSAITDGIISDIKKTNSYEKLQSSILEEYNFDNDFKVKERNIYNLENAGKTFISLDLIKANFNVLKLFNENLVLSSSTYESLISKYTEFEYFKSSKYIRQVIFGNLLPKKQNKIQKKLINSLLVLLSSELGLDKEDFITASSDEILISVKKEYLNELLERINNLISFKLNEDFNSFSFLEFVKIESFKLESISERKYFVKKYDNNDIDFKGIPSTVFFQVFKKYHNQDITEYDKTFFFDGMLATFKSEVFD
jgi:hypothetical protein